MRQIEVISCIFSIAFSLAHCMGLQILKRLLSPPPVFDVFAMVVPFYTMVFFVLGCIGYGLVLATIHSKPIFKPLIISFSLALALSTAFIGMLYVTGGLLHEEEYQLGYVLLLILSWTVFLMIPFGFAAICASLAIYFEQRKTRSS